jgi:membrane dipeptidase
MTVDRRTFVKLAGAAALAPGALAGGLPPETAGSPSLRRWPGYAQAVVIDALASPIQFNIPQSDLPLSAADLDNARRSGITALNLTVGVVGAAAPDPFEGTVTRIAAWEREVDRHPDALRRVRTAADLADAKASGRLGLIYGFQDVVPFGGNLDRIALFQGLGVRIVQLTYNDRNFVGDGSLEPNDGGLSRMGHAAVARMNDLGILVDLSHCGARTTLEGIRASAVPVSATHTGCSAVFAHPRNKDDATLRLLADRGGVAGIYLMPFLNPAGPPTAEDVLRHVEHALGVCGEDHVGIGSDQGITPLDVADPFPAQFAAVSARRQAMGIAAPREDTPPYVPELNTPKRMEMIADLMAERRHGDRVIEKVLGGNFARLFGEVWR